MFLRLLAREACNGSYRTVNLSKEPRFREPEGLPPQNPCRSENLLTFRFGFLSFDLGGTILGIPADLSFRGAIAETTVRNATANRELSARKVGIISKTRNREVPIDGRSRSSEPRRSFD